MPEESQDEQHDGGYILVVESDTPVEAYLRRNLPTYFHGFEQDQMDVIITLAIEVRRQIYTGVFSKLLVNLCEKHTFIEQPYNTIKVRGERRPHKYILIALRALFEQGLLNIDPKDLPQLENDTDP